MQNLHHVFRSLVGRMPTCVVFGEIVAWMTGWMIICEFLGGFIRCFRLVRLCPWLLDSLGFSLPQALSGAYNPTNGTYIDLIAMLVVVAVTFGYP